MVNKKTEKTATRAQKRDATKNLIKELLQKANARHGELIDEASKIYIERFPGEDTENPNDVKGRIGSVIDVMKKEGEILFDGGVYALKAEEKPAKKTRKRVVKEEKEEEKPKKRVVKKAKKEEEKKEETEEVLPLPTAPLPPIAPEITPDPVPEEKPKKRAVRKAKKTEETKPVVEEKKEEKAEETKPALVDVSFLLGATPKQTEMPKEKKEEKPQKSTTIKRVRSATVVKKVIRALTPDEKLRNSFLARLHRLGGEYFEYYSVYLLEKYSRKNGRRLESLRISAGDKDGGIDGEIELTDKMGFRETIYIQAKNWDPSKGDEKLWVVGETLVQQFIGACVCRQAKENRQHCRGIFITTSRFTPEAKKIFEDVSDKFVGYDGEDLYETAKECAFGIIKKSGEYVLDENLLSGIKAFFNMD